MPNEKLIGEVIPPSFLKEDFTVGIPMFISNVIRLLTIVAGLWMLINFILAGLQFISAQGNEEQVKNAWNKITNSMIGMIIIVVAYALTALLSYLLFDDPGFILWPTLTGAGG